MEPFDKWLDKASECLKAISGGRVFSRLSPMTMTILRDWYDNGTTPEDAAQEWLRRSQQTPTK